jgi:RNA-directed DNA polymerase
LISENINFLKLADYSFNEFLFLRGFDLLNSKSLLYSIYSNKLNIMDFNFLTSNDIFISVIPSFDLIRKYKIKLKIVVKYHQNLDISKFLLLLNKVIFFWSITYITGGYFGDICGELDVYLYKILWKWARRRHPRRPNSWVFSKYWKNFCGYWRFFSFDVIKGNVYILRSHTVNSCFLYRLPFFINSFEYFNFRKVNYFYFKKYNSFFIGVFKFLWKKQNGICHLCNKNLAFLDINSVKLFKLNVYRNTISNFMLIHFYCNF